MTHNKIYNAFSAVASTVSTPETLGAFRVSINSVPAGLFPTDEANVYVSESTTGKIVTRLHNDYATIHENVKYNALMDWMERYSAGECAYSNDGYSICCKDTIAIAMEYVVSAWAKSKLSPNWSDYLENNHFIRFSVKDGQTIADAIAFKKEELRKNGAEWSKVIGIHFSTDYKVVEDEFHGEEEIEEYELPF